MAAVEYVEGARSSSWTGHRGWVIRFDDRTTVTYKPEVHGPEADDPDAYRGDYSFDWVIRLTGVRHWQRVRNNRGDQWVPDPAGTSTARPCPIRVAGSGSWASIGPCGRPVKENGKCGVHNGADKRAAKRSQQYRDDRDRSAANKRSADDAIAALADVKLDGDRGITAHPNYSGGASFGYTGEVVVKAEDVMALIRRLRYLEGGE